MSTTRLIVTGSSGFIGRHLLEAVKGQFPVVGLARRSQLRSGAPRHPDITWHQVDIADEARLRRVFRRIAPTRDDVVIHLAAHYDFTGARHAEYERTNVTGLRNVLDVCRGFRPRRFVFSSSVAACSFPETGGVVDESSAASGRHVYAETKRIGEALLADYVDAFPSTIVRFAALFSDWCEYPPLFMFLDTWLSDRWNARVLGGQGESAIPYLHIRDATAFLRRLIERVDDHDPGEVLIASTDGAISHRDLYDEAVREWFDQPRRPLLMPRALCGPGMRAMLWLGRLRGQLPFERPWMAEYIDRRLTIDASHTRQRLDWQPRERLGLLRRLPFLLANLKADPVEWSRRNRAAMKQVRRRPSLIVHQMLEELEPEITARFTHALTSNHHGRFDAYLRLSEGEHRWNHRVALRQLMNSVITRERRVYIDYCRDLAEHRYRQGFAMHEVCEALAELNRICVEQLMSHPEAAEIAPHVRELVTMTMRYGCDQVEDTFEALELAEPRTPTVSPE